MLEKCKISGFADEIDTDIEKQIKLLKKLEIKYIEFRSGNNKGVAEYTIEEAKELKRTLWMNDIQVSAIGSPIGKIKITEDFEPHFKLFQKVVEIAKILETKNIRIFSFYIPEDEEPTKYKEEVFNRMSRLVEYAKEQGVCLLHENEKDIYGDMADRCLELMKEFYGDHFKCTFDFANFVQCEQDTIEAFELLKPYIDYIHIKDARWSTKEVVPAGEGDGNIITILKILEHNNYEGYLSLEPHLAEFAALKSLEQNVNKRALSDGEQAFSIAYQALNKILKS